MPDVRSLNEGGLSISRKIDSSWAGTYCLHLNIDANGKRWRDLCQRDMPQIYAACQVCQARWDKALTEEDLFCESLSVPAIYNYVDLVESKDLREWGASLLPVWLFFDFLQTSTTIQTKLGNENMRMLWIPVMSIQMLKSLIMVPIKNPISKVTRG